MKSRAYMKISVVVCTMNEEKYIGPCLEHLINQDSSCEIIVVDAHSTDKTLKIARKYTNKIYFDNGKGISDARNVGWKNASHDIVAYCDADSLPPKDWTKKIIKNIKNLYCVSGPLMPYDGNTLMKINFLLWSDFYPRIMGLMGYHNVWGANMAFKKSILKKFPFKMKFLEDHDIGVRLRKTFKVKFCEDIKLPVSCRRFEKGFYRTSINFYVREWMRRKIIKKSTTGYYK